MLQEGLMVVSRGSLMAGSHDLILWFLEEGRLEAKGAEPREGTSVEGAWSCAAEASSKV